MYESYLEHVKKHGERNTTIDRIDSDGNYSKSNCRWATYKEQGRNQKTALLVTIDNETLSVTEWSERYSISRKTVYSRIKDGWNPIAAVQTPIKKKPYAKEQGLTLK